jgi:hypothetical protein
MTLWSSRRAGRSDNLVCMKVPTLFLTAAGFLAFACSTPAATTSPGPAVTAAATPTATSPIASAAPTAPPTARAGFATHESPILGYRITMPDPYRRLWFVVNSGSAETLGSETYTRRTEVEERELCLRSQGDVPPREWETDVVILTYRNVDSVSAAQFANTPRVSGGQAFSANRTMEPVTVDGRDAVRLVWEPTKGGETAGYVIPANGRMYVVMPPVASLPSQLPKGWLDEIATSFRAVTPQPAPAPTPSAAPTPRCGA